MIVRGTTPSFTFLLPEFDGSIDSPEPPEGVYEQLITLIESGMQRLEDGNKITQRALLELLAHGIDGNDIDAMKKAKTDLINHLIEQ